jgi:acetoin utilization deacetylase AcuC-like enzyme
VWDEQITNALNCMVAVGHHAGISSAWGGTYASLTGPTIQSLREKNPDETIRFAIIDTDSHHADGTRDMFYGDHDVLHICFCDEDMAEDDATKFCIDVGWQTTDQDYLKKLETNLSRVKEFKPNMIIHLLGHDTHKDDYGSRGLSKKFFLDLVELINDYAKEICKGRYIITTMGGDNVEVADYIFPRIIKILSNHN